MSRTPRYESIGLGYARYRREEPKLRRAIHAALGDAKSVVNVGAGTGSYEPTDRQVLAVEPSDVMAQQRGRGRVPAIRAWADALPLRDDSVDAAMALVTIHHWDESQQRGIEELCRVARERVVIVTYDPAVAIQMWLARDYFPELAALDQRVFVPISQVVDWLGGAEVRVLPIPRNSKDRMLGAFWAHPEWVLDPEVRAGTSGFARQPESVVERVVKQVRTDLASGAWEERNGALSELDEYDSGLRLVIAEPS